MQRGCEQESLDYKLEDFVLCSIHKSDQWQAEYFCDVSLKLVLHKYTSKNMTKVAL